MDQRVEGALIAHEAAPLIVFDPSDDALDLHGAIDAARTQIETSLTEIRDIVRTKTDWRSTVRRHPYRSLGVALGIGFLLGLR
jgi:ElaB/YqjD/DUF883 family membrane-anchored ribosome-binding protein